MDNVKRLCGSLKEAYTDLDADERKKLIKLLKQQMDDSYYRAKEKKKLIKMLKNI